MRNSKLQGIDWRDIQIMNVIMTEYMYSYFHSTSHTRAFLMGLLEVRKNKECDE